MGGGFYTLERKDLGNRQKEQAKIRCLDRCCLGAFSSCETRFIGVFKAALVEHSLAFLTH